MDACNQEARLIEMEIWECDWSRLILGWSGESGWDVVTRFAGLVRVDVWVDGLPKVSSPCGT